jgi:hypothetical protein
MDFEKAKEFWNNLANELPDEIGSILSPMPINKIDFRPSGTADVDRVAESESHMFSAAGVSSQLFNDANASSSSLKLSIISDQNLTYSVVKSIESVLTRLLQNQPFGKNFKVNMIDCSPVDRDSKAELVLKAAQNGLPTISLYCAMLGINQLEMEGLNFLEDNLLDLKNKLMPLKTSSTLSSEDSGRPTNASKGKGLDKSGEQTEIDNENQNR